MVKFFFFFKVNIVFVCVSPITKYMHVLCRQCWKTWREENKNILIFNPPSRPRDSHLIFGSYPLSCSHIFYMYIIKLMSPIHKICFLLSMFVNISQVYRKMSKAWLNSILEFDHLYFILINSCYWTFRSFLSLACFSSKNSISENNHVIYIFVYLSDYFLRITP